MSVVQPGVKLVSKFGLVGWLVGWSVGWVGGWVGAWVSGTELRGRENCATGNETSVKVWFGLWVG